MRQRDRQVFPRIELGEIMTQNDLDNLTVLKKSRTKYPDQPLIRRSSRTSRTNTRSRDYTIEFDCPEFTSLCPITGQPDFARITITYIPDLKCIESKSLKLYLFSFRNTGMFHEEITNRILDDLVASCEPRWARVRGVMNARGGISIEVTAEYSKSGFKR